ncbi:hypothetical protein DC094_18615 [Pelagibaculum spongiae]|uniref:Uncharacterized protein n=1 Tax=Pelagibaculum spongiae TaxID=2080658 RepID=A0A2V1GTU4_9GAMM|nr:hypothetical protein DC094_18615 [Pelagibaculum spongiae]
MTNRFKISALSVAIALTIAGCGGGGASSDSSSGINEPGKEVNPAVVTVFDGYLQGVRVCADRDGNGQCAAAEYFEGETDKLGQLAVSDINQSLIAEVEAGVTKDLDYGESPLHTGYQLRGVPGNAMISPISDLVMTLAIVGSESGIPSPEDIDNSKQHLLQQLNQSGLQITAKDLMGDYVLKHTITQEIQAELDHLAAEKSDLEAETAALQNEISNLIGEVGQLTNDISGLEADVVDLDAGIEKLIKDIAELKAIGGKDTEIAEKEATKLEKEATKLEKETLKKQTEVTRLEKETLREEKEQLITVHQQAITKIEANVQVIMDDLNKGYQLHVIARGLVEAADDIGGFNSGDLQTRADILGAMFEKSAIVVDDKTNAELASARLEIFLNAGRLEVSDQLLITPIYNLSAVEKANLELDALNLDIYGTYVEFDNHKIIDLAEIFSTDQATFALVNGSAEQQSISIKGLTFDIDQNKVLVVSGLPSEQGEISVPLLARAGKGRKVLATIKTQVGAIDYPITTSAAAIVELEKNLKSDKIHWRLNSPLALTLPAKLFSSHVVKEVVPATEGNAEKIIYETLTVSLGEQTVHGLTLSDNYTVANGGKITGVIAEKGAGKKIQLVVKNETGAKFNYIIELVEITSENNPPVIDPFVLEQFKTEFTGRILSRNEAINVPIPSGLVTDADGDKIKYRTGLSMVPDLGYDSETNAITGALQADGDGHKIHFSATDGEDTVVIEFGLNEINQTPDFKLGASRAVTQQVDTLSWPKKEGDEFIFEFPTEYKVGYGSNQKTISVARPEDLFSDPDGEDSQLRIALDQENSIPGLTLSEDHWSISGNLNGWGDLYEKKISIFVYDDSGSRARFEIGLLEILPIVPPVISINADEQAKFEAAVQKAYQDRTFRVGQPMTDKEFGFGQGVAIGDLFTSGSDDKPVLNISVGEEMAKGLDYHPGGSFPVDYGSHIRGRFLIQGSDQKIHLVATRGGVSKDYFYKFDEILPAAKTE